MNTPDTCTSITCALKAIVDGQLTDPEEIRRTLAVGKQLEDAWLEDYAAFKRLVEGARGAFLRPRTENAVATDRCHDTITTAP